ncbi:hypothetical protein [Amycolatopsis sp. NPDC058986]|uniref:hypothetical protein n=1 Tax=Amycolatopsis sp. NPDC058986 TaxID=3346685 RepID=UPI00366EEC32
MVRPAPAARTLTVARVALPVRRVRAVPSAEPAPGRGVDRPGLPPADAAPDRPVLGETPEQPGEPDVALQRVHADASPLPVIPAPEVRKPGLGAPMSELPVTAQRTTPEPRNSTSDTGRSGNPGQARQPVGLGEPLHALPPTAKTLGPDVPPSPSGAVPGVVAPLVSEAGVAQRIAEATEVARSRRSTSDTERPENDGRARPSAILGEPLPALPPTAQAMDSGAAAPTFAPVSGMAPPNSEGGLVQRIAASETRGGKPHTDHHAGPELPVVSARDDADAPVAAGLAPPSPGARPVPGLVGETPSAPEIGAIHRIADPERTGPVTHRPAEPVLPVVSTPEQPTSVPLLSEAPIQRFAESARTGEATPTSASPVGEPPLVVARPGEPAWEAERPIVRELLADRPLTRSMAEPAPAPESTVDRTVVAPVRWVRSGTQPGSPPVQRATAGPAAPRRPAAPRPALRGPAQPGPAQPGPASPRPAIAPNWPSRHGVVLSETPVQRAPAGTAPAVVAPVRPPAAPGAPVVPARWVPELPIAAPASTAATIQRDADPSRLSVVTSGFSATTSSPEEPDTPPGTPIDTPPGTPVGEATENTDGEPPKAAEHLGIEELARRLAEPVSRLLRAELRTGRERAGRLHTRRR